MIGGLIIGFISGFIGGFFTMAVLVAASED